MHEDGATEYDVIVVGAGAGGCVVASRLSEDPRCRTLLIEAGIDIVPGHEPPEILDVSPRSFCNPAFLWPDLNVEVTEAHDGRPGARRLFEQGRLMGGGSNLMGMSALWGTPEDYDEWRDLGAVGWGWDDVHPFFRKLEHDMDFALPQHGSDGPMTIHRFGAERWPPFTRALAGAFAARGFPFIADLNTDYRDGFGPMPLSISPATRLSSSIAYLTAVVRSRSNLTIATETTAHRILFQGRSVSGAEARTGNRVVRYGARKVVVCAGAIQTPALIQRSGVGPGAMLRAIGSEVIAERNGVGGNLSNHARVYAAAHLRRQAQQPDALRPFNVATLRYSSHHADSPLGDMQLVLMNRSYWHRIGRSVAAIGPTVYKPFSRGTVAVTSPEPESPPDVRFRLASDPRDLERLTQGLRFAFELLADPRVAPMLTHCFMPRSSPLLNRMHRLGRWNAVKSAAAALVVDNSGPLRPMLLSFAGDLIETLPTDPDAFREMVFQSVGYMYHPAGTCRAGAADDPLAVVDADGAAYGVEGLYVADASVMPTLPRGNTNISTMMIGEKVAAGLRRRTAA